MALRIAWSYFAFANSLWTLLDRRYLPSLRCWLSFSGVPSNSPLICTWNLSQATQLCLGVWPLKLEAIAASVMCFIWRVWFSRRIARFLAALGSISWIPTPISGMLLHFSTHKCSTGFVTSYTVFSTAIHFCIDQTISLPFSYTGVKVAGTSNSLELYSHHWDSLWTLSDLLNLIFAADCLRHYTVRCSSNSPALFRLEFLLSCPVFT